MTELQLLKGLIKVLLYLKNKAALAVLTDFRSVVPEDARLHRS